MKARVRGGRLVLDEPIDLPEGSEVEVVIADEGDALDEADRARLHAALARSAEQFDAGKGVDADEALARLRLPRTG
jgi:predicted DNA-binding antitoxin AbrB/MazE fold protein